MMRGMRAVVLDAPGPPETLRIQELPTPVPEPGWVLIEVKAFGLNRSQLHHASASPRGSRSRACRGSISRTPSGCDALRAAASRRTHRLASRSKVVE